MGTFSQETKDDLCTVFLKKRCCRAAFLCGAMLPGHAEEGLPLSTENESFAELYCRMVQSVFGIRPERNDGGTLVIPDREEEARIREALGDFVLSDPDAPLFCGCDGDKSAFLRGVFLSCGTVTEPEADYHLELLPPDDPTGEGLCAFLGTCSLPPKVLRRQGSKHETLYYKDSEAMEDFLHFIGAHRSAFRLSDVKIMRELRNNSNRLRNCDTANIVKTVNAARQQMDAILLIAEKGKEGDLPPELRETFDLRAANPELSLADLAALHTVPLSRSGLSHRLTRLIRFAQRLQEEETEETRKNEEENGNE